MSRFIAALLYCSTALACTTLLALAFMPLERLAGLMIVIGVSQ